MSVQCTLIQSEVYILLGGIIGETFSLKKITQLITHCKKS